MRLRTMIIFGAGYIWGARSGHDRLLELTDRARDLLNSDLVRDYVARMQTARVGDELTESEEPDEELDEELEEPEDFEEDEDVDEDLEEEPGEPEELEEASEDEEPQPARSRARRRAPGRARR
jgi:hypothetical protein